MQKNPIPVSRDSGGYREPLLRPSLGIQIALSLWMTAVLAFYLLMYTPPIIENIVDKLGLKTGLSVLREEIKPFFQTEDFNKNKEIR